MLSTKNENQISLASPNALKAWVLSARPKTLIAGVSPVLIGAAVASEHAALSYPLLFLCLMFSLAIQVGANWANDYFDAVKGADTIDRKGPARAVQSGWISPRSMKRAFCIAFGAAALISLPLLFRLGLFFAPLMLLCILCAVLYTGGKRPLGYLGLGELLVLIFYGPVAVCCTAAVLVGSIPPEAWIASWMPGCFSCALLTVNNLRDRNEDLKANKLTLVARFGMLFGKIEYIAYFIAPFAILALLLLQGAPTRLMFLFALLPLAIKPMTNVYKETEWNLTLALTAQFFAFFTILFCLAYAHL